METPPKNPAPALAPSLQAPAASVFISKTITEGVGPAATPVRSEVHKKYEVDTSDIVAVGILVLAIAAAFVAVVVALGFVFGKVNGADTVKIVGTCVGGSTISGVIAALVGRKPKSSRRAR
jgi:hypothetical protein